jgi:hypothetical protein
MIEIELKPSSDEEVKEWNKKYMKDGKIDWKKLNADISAEILENHKRTQKWQAWAIKFSVPTD